MSEPQAEQTRILVNLSECDMPATYLRGRVNTGYIAELYDRLKAAKAEGGKDAPLSIPFPDVDVRLLPKPTKAQKEKGIKYEVIDGVHRMAAYVKFGLVAVPAVLHEGLSDYEAVMFQYRRTGSSGLRFKRTERDEAVRIIARISKLTGANLARLTGLSEPTISRILKAPTEKAEKAEKAWSADRFFQKIRNLMDEADEHTAELDAAWKSTADPFTSEAQWDQGTGQMLEAIEAVEAARQAAAVSETPPATS